MYVIATAGHVDHGKSTLVRALTGINPDRLREEQEREMTIDLGFAWMNLPDANHTPVGIIDVPGHIDFIENMLAGVGGIDAALLVIAADEGPMPQTREHIAILQLLRVQRGVVVLTKTDRVDADWVELMRAEIATVLKDTPLAHAPVVAVSAREGRGLDELLQTLAQVLQDAPPRKDHAKPRLPIDRVFSVQGFGTVVTGTLVDGSLALGDDVEILTQTGAVIPSKVRGLQTHKQKLERASAGSRVAINLSNVDVAQAARGGVVAQPNVLQPSTLLDVQIELLALPRETGTGVLRHNTELKIFHGAAQSMATLWLLEGNELQRGRTGWAQLQLRSHMALANGDRFILRLPSPSVTVGGGVVVDAHPPLRYRRRGGRVDDAVIHRLEALLRGTPAQRLANVLQATPFISAQQAGVLAQLNATELAFAINELQTTGVLLASSDVLAMTAAWHGLMQHASELLAGFHAAQPLQPGMPRDTLRSQLKLEAKVFNALLARTPENFADDGDTARLVSFQVGFSPPQQVLVDGLLAQCRAHVWNTPSVKECRAVVGDAAYDVLLRQRTLVQCGTDVVLLPETFDDAVAQIRDYIQKNGQITAAQVRDLFATTRKYALGLLEHLDATGVTKRVGDARVMK